MHAWALLELLIAAKICFNELGDKMKYPSRTSFGNHLPGTKFGPKMGPILFLGKKLM